MTTLLDSTPPVLTVDGPSGSGKGTVCKTLAHHLGWHYLDSGALYRTLSIAAIQRHVDLDDEMALTTLVDQIDLHFTEQTSGEWVVMLDGVAVGDQLQTEKVGRGASTIAALPKVRDALLEKQHGFLEMPGLVADGRDMGSVVFPDAKYKIYLTASAESRGERRYKQLIEKGIGASLPQIIQDIEQRDRRDQQRSVSPLKVPDGALVLDSTELTIEETVQNVLNYMQDIDK